MAKLTEHGTNTAPSFLEKSVVDPIFNAIMGAKCGLYSTPVLRCLAPEQPRNPLKMGHLAPIIALKMGSTTDFSRNDGAVLVPCSVSFAMYVWHAHV